MIVQPDLSEFGSRNHTISRLQKEGPHIHSDNPSSVAILQVNTFSVRLHLYIYSTILHGPLCLKLFWGETSQHKPSPKIHPPRKNGMNNQQSTNYIKLWENKPSKKKHHPSNLNHQFGVCVCFTGGKFRLAPLGSWCFFTLRIWKRWNSPMFPKVAFPYVVSTSRLGMPKGGGLKDGAWGRVGCVVHVGCWLMVDGWWLGSKKGQFFLETRHFLGGNSCKAAKFSSVKCIHKEIHGLESTTQYGSRN